MSQSRKIFQQKLEKLECKINTLNLEDSKKYELTHQVKKITGNILLFEKNITLYGDIETGLAKLNTSIFQAEQELKKKKKETEALHDSVSPARDYGSISELQPTAPKLEKKSSTCFSLLSFFSCFGHQKDSTKSSANNHKRETVSIDSISVENPKAAQTHHSVSDSFKNGLSYISNLFCSCFGARRKGYEPIKTMDSPTFTSNFRRKM